jgi:triacylglycerol lipase
MSLPSMGLRKRYRRAMLGAAVALLGLALSPAGALAAVSGPALTEPSAALEHALDCHGDVRGADQPTVILVHGTGSSPEESFSWGYAHVLPKLGFPVCTVRLPGHAVGDFQRSMQYVVYAIRETARRSGRTVSLIGHSQGAALAVYAPYFWPDLPAKIEDVIGLAGPYRGSKAADAGCAGGGCPAFAWQVRTGSRLSAALAAKPQPAGPSFTAIATSFDQLVTPAPQAALLPGASNVLIQDLCPARAVDHFLLVADAVAFAVAVDALTHEGPADRSRVSPATCLETIMPGADLAKFAVIAPIALTNALARMQAAPKLDREPALQCPFDAGACPSPQLRLTRRCVRGGRLHYALAGDLETVRGVEFKLGRRLVRRDASAPFTGTLAARHVRSHGGARLRAIVSLEGAARTRMIVSRTLPRCG